MLQQSHSSETSENFAILIISNPQQSKKMSLKETPDQWRYIILLAKFGFHFVFMGIAKSLSVLIPSLVLELDQDYTSIGFLVSMEFGNGVSCL